MKCSKEWLMLIASNVRAFRPAYCAIYGLRDLVADIARARGLRARFRSFWETTNDLLQTAALAQDRNRACALPRRPRQGACDRRAGREAPRHVAHSYARWVGIRHGEPDMGQGWRRPLGPRRFKPQRNWQGGP